MRDKKQDQVPEKTAFRKAISTFKPSITGMDRNTAWAMILEGMFCATTYGIYLGLAKTMEGIRPGFEAINLDRDSWAANPALIQKAIDGVESVLWQVGLATLAWTIIFLAAYCLFNAMIWAQLGKRQTNREWIIRWMSATMPWTILWAILFLLMIIIFKPEWYTWTVPIWVILYEYLTLPLHIIMTSDIETGKWKAVKTALWTALLEPGEILQPLAIWTTAYLPLTILLGAITDMTNTWIQIPYLILMTIWLRRYTLLCTQKTAGETFK